jgi:broad specificity phosphatase PhoE
VAKRITFIRHGKTGKADTDIDRQLTQQGFDQAAERRDALNRQFGLVMSSVAPRAVDTAVVIGECMDALEVLLLESLYLPTDSADRAAVEAMSGQLGYAPLRAYRAADTEGVLKRYGENAAADIAAVLRSQLAEEVLVVGHAVLLNAVAAAVIGTDTDTLLDAELGECEGIELDYSPTVRLIR